MRRVIVLCLVAVLVAACSGSGGSDEARSSTTTTQAAAVDPVVPAAGRVLAEVKGVGQVLQGSAVFRAGDPKVRAAKARPVPDLEGLLVAGPGLTAEVGSRFTGALQVRLDVPKPPTDSAVPVVVHRGADGRVSIEPALWDPGTSQMVVRASSFSDRWGGWVDPRNWAEEVVQGGQGAFDFVADFVTGRTDQPACRKDPPGWASVATSEVSSLHVCEQSNPATDGTERFELFLKSNRQTVQLVTIPTVELDYVWAEHLPDGDRRLLTALAGVDPGSNTLLLGANAMSLGFRRPPVKSESFDVLAYQGVPRIIIVNPVFAFLGDLLLEELMGVMAAVAKCQAEAAGINVARLDRTPDDTRLDANFLESMVRCAFGVIQHPDLAVDVVREVAAKIGVRDSAGLSKVETALHSLAPTANRIANGLDRVGPALTNLWDNVFDNLADGRITVTLTAPPPAFDRDEAAARWVRLDEQCRGQTTGIDQAACDRRDALTAMIWPKTRSAFFRAWQRGDLATGERLSTDGVRTDPGFSTAKLFDLRPTEQQLDCRNWRVEGFACYVTVRRASGQEFDVYLTFDMQLGYVLLKSWRPDV